MEDIVWMTLEQSSEQVSGDSRRGGAVEAGDVIRSGCLLKAHGWEIGQKGLEKQRSLGGRSGFCLSPLKDRGGLFLKRRRLQQE